MCVCVCLCVCASAFVGENPPEMMTRPRKNPEATLDSGADRGSRSDKTTSASEFRRGRAGFEKMSIKMF